MFAEAFLVALIAGICKIDNRVFPGMTMIQRPLIVGTLVGIYLWKPCGRHDHLGRAV